MNHLDEGTIHAWLDDALDAEQAAAVQAHADACAECSAKVAEARGLIAASSRILIALDDVPAGVTPQRAVPPARRMRRWASSPWVYAAAAGLVMVALWRTGGVNDRAPFSSSLERVLNQSFDSVPGVPLPPIPSLDSLLGPTIALPRPPAPQVAIGAARGADAVAAASVRGGAGAGVSGALSEAAQVAAAPATVPTQPRADSVNRLRDAAPPAELQRGEVSRAVAKLETVAAEAKDAVAAPATWSGCYRVTALARREAVGDRSREVATAALANEANRRARASAGAPTSAAAPAPAAAKAFSEVASETAMIRLDTLAARAGFAVRPVRSDSTIGSWRELSADSVRVDLGTRGTFTFAKRDRIVCPE